MKQRPLLFVILGIIHLMEPLSKILFLKLESGFAFDQVFSNVAQIEGVKHLFEFWILFPLGGIALLSVKRWSYGLFVSVQAYSLYSVIFYEKFTWPYVSSTPFLSSMVIITFNMLMLIYFALPNVRAPFFDRRMRWWETKTRYDIKVPVRMEGKFCQGESFILNISETGAFIRLCPGFQVGDTLRISFKHHGSLFTLNGRIVNRHTINGVQGHGIQFLPVSWGERFLMRKYINRLKKSFKNSLETNLV